MNRVTAFLFGVALGTVLGLTIAWQAPSPDPSQIAADPAALTSESKETYILLVSMAYMQDGDLERAKQRLALLNDFGLRDTLAALSDRYTSELRPEAQRRALAKLAVAMGADSAALRVYVVTPTPSLTPNPSPTPTETPEPPTPTPTATSTPTPPTTFTPNPSPTPAPRVTFRVLEQTRVPCDPSGKGHAVLAIAVQNAGGQGLPGVRVRVQWNDGQDEFFTGLKSPDPGYAEFETQPGKTYSVLVADSTSQVAFGLESGQLDPECPNDGLPHFQAWRVVFRRNE